MLEKFKNLKVKVKLNIGFSVLLFFLLLISIVSIFFVYNLYNTNKHINTYISGPTHDLFTMTKSLDQQRISALKAILFIDSNPQLADEEVESIKESESTFDKAFNSYSSNMKDEDVKKNKELIESVYYEDFSEAKEQFLIAYDNKDKQELATAIEILRVSAEEVSVYMENSSDAKIEYSEALNKNSSRTFFVMIGIIVLLLIISFICTWYVIARITRSVKGPITRMSKIAGQVADTGNFNFSEKIIKEVKIDASYNDEVGLTTRAFSKMMDDLIDKKNILEHVAGGDLTVQARIISPDDVLGNSINSMIYSLREIVKEIDQASTQINKSAEQLANGSQVLAQGAAEQSSSVEHLQNYIEDVRDKSDASIKVSTKTSEVAKRIKTGADEGRIKMDKLHDASEEVHNASQAIEKVTKAVNDIAFQTNILSLNAAIEAARAGVHGKGFSVVSDEVRSLAGKSGEAANETAQYVSDSIEKSALGSKLAKDATETFRSIADGIDETSTLAAELNSFFESQKEAIAMIQKTIDQLSQVIHQNSSAAEETAANTEEMNHQTESMQNLISGFIIDKEK